MTKGKKMARLSNSVSPKEYQIKVSIHPEQGIFSGRVQILLHFNEPVRFITLHAQDLEIGQARIEFEKKDRFINPQLDPTNTTVRFDLPNEFTEKSGVLEIPFSGKINQQMKGLYQAKAKIEGTEEKYAFTHFEPTDARRFFPCFDEPGYKATFQVTATAPAHLAILSNMPAGKETIEKEMKTVEFETTPVMSTYLLALGVGRLVSKTQTIAGTQVSIWALEKDIHLSDFAMEVTEGVLPLLNEYFDMPYPYPKLDLISVPDFAMGAMENWGAIFFRDSCLLVDKASSSTKAKRRVANVITHEIVHQWFGNLVTMAWWDDLWLNEAFATWLACKIVDQWSPQWRSWEEFQQEKAVPLELDALDNSRAIISEVGSSAEIEAMFDPLTYEKGAAVLRMFEHYLKEEPFRAGIRSYMKRFQFQNTVADDLWKELEAASNQPVRTLAKDWLTQPGYPIVAVKPVSQKERTFQFHQKKFSAHGDAKIQKGFWSIPLVVHYKDSTGIHKHRFLMQEENIQQTLPGNGPVAWVYPNGEEAGFLRIQLEKNLWKNLLSSAQTSLNAAERVGLINHTWAVVSSNVSPIDDFMETLSAFKGDSTRVVVEMLSSYLEELTERFLEKETRPLMGRYVKNLINPVWEKLGWEGKKDEDDEVRLARNSVIWTLGYVVGPQELIKQIEDKLKKFHSNPSTLDPILVDTVVRLGARNGDEALFKEYQTRFKQAQTPEERDRYLIALSDFQAPELANRLMEMTLSDAVRGQDLWRPYRYLFPNPVHQEATWTFIKTHWQNIKEKTGPIGAHRIIQCTKALWREDWHKEVASFFKQPENQIESAVKVLDQTLEFIELGIKFKAAQQERLIKWLKNF
ncbi:MAG TPA: M1 family metallopeptidase [Nitrospiria bacterium]|jgi:puromycin-sensitive aminopeptidase